MALSKNSPRRVRAAEKKKDALALRKEGLTYVEIAEKLGTSKGEAYRLVSKAVEAIQKECAESAAQMMQIVQGQLNDLYNQAYEKIGTAKTAASSLRAMQTCVQILDRIAKLNGIEPPTKSENKHTIVDAMNEEDLRSEAQRLGILPRAGSNVKPATSEPDTTLDA